MSWRTSKNVAIFGGTQQGKSTLANRVFREDPRIGIYWSGGDAADWMTGTIVRTCREIVAGMQASRKKFVFELPMFSQSLQEHHERLVKWLMVMGQQHGMGTVLVTDEAHEIAPEGGTTETSLHLSVKRGLKRNLRNLVVTQDPASISSKIIRQCDFYVWVGPCDPFTVEYLEGKNISAGPFAQLGKHEYAVIDRTGTLFETGTTNP